ncbi:hypothetical protein CRT60_01365 [Azospirillum palustre]|uniref:Uncharacterized protein n=1 Tax=Azospirillum palustre TaxID=2044885 RepID=A0A2B8BQ02_9PROT|nr:tetratricopeptide repeat protein [Azospirillum palustre]PGH59307.1 hypothetical protein CRT60_01365 [Azospirillum palustre]
MTSVFKEKLLRESLENFSYHLGNGAYASGDREGALALYKRCLDGFPHHAKASFNAFLAARDLGIEAEAQAFLVRTNDLDPKAGAQALSDLAEVFTIQNKLQDALVCSRAAFEQNSDDPALCLDLLWRALTDGGNTPSGPQPVNPPDLGLVDQLLGMSWRFGAADRAPCQLADLFRALRASGDHPRLERAYQAAAQSDFGDWGWCELLLRLARESEWIVLVPLCRIMISRFPEVGTPYLLLCVARSQIEGGSAEARKEILDLWPKAADQPCYGAPVDMFRWLGIYLWSNGKPTAALRVAEAGEKYHPNAMPLRSVLAHANRMLGRFDVAERIFLELSETGDAANRAEAKLSLGLICISQGRFAEAETRFIQSGAQHQNPSLLLNRAAAIMLQSRFAEARDLLESAEGRALGWVSLYFLVLLDLLAGDLDRADRDMERWQADPDQAKDGMILQITGLLRQARGDAAAALELYREGARRNPGWSMSPLCLALGLFSNGLAEEGDAVLRDAAQDGLGELMFGCMFLPSWARDIVGRGIPKSIPSLFPVSE